MDQSRGSRSSLPLPCTLTQPHQQNKVDAKPSGFEDKVSGQNSARHDIVSVGYVIHEPVTVTPPLLDPRTVLKVIHLRVSRLPFLQGTTVPNQPKLYWRNNEVEALQFNSFAELFS
jgi:hypothetical protein